MRQTSTGELYWLGRGDGQVKVRGNRIDVGEVVRRLELYRDVSMAHVTTLAREGTDDLALVAYVRTGGDISRDELDQWISEDLPDYMVPSHYVAVENLPLLPNGKMDTRSLPAPTRSNTLRGESRAKSKTPGEATNASETETVILRIVRRLLHDDEITVDDSFIELGGSSATAFIGASMITRELETRIAPELLLEPICLGEVIGRVERLENISA